MNLLPNDIIVFNAIKRLISDNLYLPTLKEVKNEANLTSISLVKHYVDRLIKNGYLESQKYQTRSIRIIKELNGGYEVQS